jgi:Bardet-Biedl syndrome 2 protein
VSLLNINAIVTSLATGKLNESSQNDILVVGTSTNLLAYDVNNNVDLFYKDVRTVFNDLTIGKYFNLSHSMSDFFFAFQSWLMARIP